LPELPAEAGLLFAAAPQALRETAIAAATAAARILPVFFIIHPPIYFSHLNHLSI
jgi:hypothetical protein